MKLTPGLRFIFRGLINLSVPALGVFGGFYVLDSVLGYSLPPFLKWTLIGTAGPMINIIHGIWVSVKQKYEMRSLGAREVPIMSGKWPGNIDVLFDLLKAFKTGYIATTFKAQPFWPVIEKLGPIINIRVLGGDGYLTTEPEHVKQILATEFHNFEKGEVFIDLASSILGTGVFNSDGDMWKFHRTMTRPFFVRDRISHFDIFSRHADSVISQIRSCTARDRAFDVQDLLAGFTLDAATEFLFGREHCVGALGAGMRMSGDPDPKVLGVEPQSDVFVTAFADAQVELAMRLRRGITWPLWEVWRDRSKQPMDVVHAYLDPIVTGAIRKKRSSQVMGRSPDEKGVHESKSEDDESLLDNLVAKTDDVSILRDELMNIMIAGRDTTAATLTFAIYLMAMYPSFTKRLREEILEKVGSSRNPTYDDIRDMKYLRAFINETLRLYPIVPFNVRTSINATTFPPCKSGEKAFYIPPKTSVSYSVFMMHRRTDLWGPDALEFDPDRFLDERLHKYLTPNPFIFLPFNAGPRICLGQQFAYNEVSFMLVRLLQAFDSLELDMNAQPADSHAPEEWKAMPGRQAVEQLFPKCHLTMYLHKGLWVRMHEATDN